MKAVKVKIMRLPHGAGLPLPAYQSADAAGLDLMAAVPASNQDVPEGQCNQPDIAFQRTAADIVRAQIELARQKPFTIELLRVCVAGKQLLLVAEDERRKVSEPRPRGEYRLPANIRNIGMLRDLRARTDDGHLTSNHVPELWKLIDLVIPQQLSEGSNALVVSSGDAGPGAACFHAPQLEKHEGAPVLADPALAKQDGSAVSDNDSDCTNSEEGNEAKQHQGRADALQQIQQRSKFDSAFL